MRTVVATVGGFEVFIGTRGTYTTVGAYETSEIADDYPVHFYVRTHQEPLREHIRNRLRFLENL